MYKEGGFVTATKFYRILIIAKRLILQYYSIVDYFRVLLTFFSLKFLNWADSIFDNLESENSIILNVLEWN